MNGTSCATRTVHGKPGRTARTRLATRRSSTATTTTTTTPTQPLGAISPRTGTQPATGSCSAPLLQPLPQERHKKPRKRRKRTRRKGRAKRTRKASRTTTARKARRRSRRSGADRRRLPVSSKLRSGRREAGQLVESDLVERDRERNLARGRHQCAEADVAPISDLREGRAGGCGDVDSVDEQRREPVTHAEL